MQKDKKMNIKKLLKYTEKPALYEPGNALMWTDPYISEQLLDIHLNEHIDLGSRKPETIQKTVDWIISLTNKKKLNILDLGCGPGLYAENFAGKGHEVTGVDFSKNSIEYAVKEAKRKNLAINYINKNYLELELGTNQYDLVTLIFTDFGPLLPTEREHLLTIIKKILKPGGLFVFDVLNDKDIQGKVSPKSWEASEKGFWSDNPYLCLSESFLYEKEKVVLYQNSVLIDENDFKIYRFWNHFFSNSDLSAILKKYNFYDIVFHENIIPSGDGYQSNDVTFCMARNTM